MQVKVEETPNFTSRAAASPNHNATSALANPTPSPTFSPLTTVRSVRTQFYAIDAAFKFPTVLDFDQSELAVTPNNAPVRAYEQALNDFLKQLDAIESDGDEEVRNVRREVVREVEQALENVERRIREQAPTPEVSKEEVKGYDVECEGPKDPITRDVPLSNIASVTEDVKVSDPEPTTAASPIDADVDLAISGEYVSTAALVSSPKAVTSELVDASPTPPVSEKAADFDADEAAALSSEDSSDSVASGTITATTAAPALPSSDETFLASMSHDQFRFPPKPASRSGTTSAPAQQDDVVLVDGSDDGESVKGGEDGWSKV
jgi:BAG domain